MYFKTDWTRNDNPGLRFNIRGAYYCKISQSLEADLELCWELYDRPKIWQATQQQCCRGACQISQQRDIQTTNLATSRLHEILR